MPNGPNIHLSPTKDDGKFEIDNSSFAGQSMIMQSDWASENLQVIRTLMERGAVYRRARSSGHGRHRVDGHAAAPAVVGVVAGVKTGSAFAGYWLAVAVVCAVEAFLLVRRQALKEDELFWSPPTRRVTQALGPALFLAASPWAGRLAVLRLSPGGACLLPLVPIWMVLFTVCALHSARLFHAARLPSSLAGGFISERVFLALGFLAYSDDPL